MTDDEKKIMTHLLYRSCKADSCEIEKAWKFEDFDAALSSLVEKGYVSKAKYIDKSVRGSFCRLTQAGIEVLKETKQ